MLVVIMAGGKGTRIESVANDIPKPMIPVFEKPILEYQLETLRSQGFKQIILVIGHLGHVIKDYFQDGKKFGVEITYFVEENPLGTAGALYYLKDKLMDPFLLINGDIIFDIDVNRFMNYHILKGRLATIFTHPNNHPYDSGIIQTDEEGIVNCWLNKEDVRLFYKNRVNAGLHIISPGVLDYFKEPGKIDLDRDILKVLISKKELCTYDSPEYVKDMGTPERYYQVCDDISSGKVKSKNLSKKQKAVFLDRDGTVNKYKGFLTNSEDFELIDGVGQAIRKINESGYLAIVITNQPIIARGECSVDELQIIHNKMETLLGEQGAYIDDIFYCPHHPDKGFPGERIEYKIQCECRKPKPGMILAAAKKYNIDLTKSIMIGDDDRDYLAGQAVGCRTILLEESTNNKEGIETYIDLITCINSIL